MHLTTQILMSSLMLKFVLFINQTDMIHVGNL